MKETKEAREEEKAVRALIPEADKENAHANVNVKGMEHVKLLGDVLFERWCEGLRVRWGGNGSLSAKTAANGG